MTPLLRRLEAAGHSCACGEDRHCKMHRLAQRGESLLAYWRLQQLNRAIALSRSLLDAAPHSDVERQARRELDALPREIAERGFRLESEGRGMRWRVGA